MSVRPYSGRVNALKRYRPPDDPAIADAERDLAAASLEEHVRKVVDLFPPLTQAQRDRLAVLLRPAPDSGEVA
ncbi:MAG: hypothetical protein ACRDN9_04785 [Streptosporangiaceae bacterium]